jgi:hypothetical protein
MPEPLACDPTAADPAMVGFVSNRTLAERRISVERSRVRSNKKSTRAEVFLTRAGTMENAGIALKRFDLVLQGC